MIEALILSVALNFVMLATTYWYKMKHETCAMFYQIVVTEGYFEIRKDGKYQLKYVKVEDDEISS